MWSCFTEHKRTEIQRELQSLQSREVGLLSCQQSLERDLKVATLERSKFKEQLDQSQLELAKTRIMSQSMEKKNKVCVQNCLSCVVGIYETLRKYGLWA